MKKLLLILIIGIFIAGTIGAISLVGNSLIGSYEKVKDVDKIKSQEVCKELVKWKIYPKETDCSKYQDKDLEGSNIKITEINPKNLEGNVYVVKYGE